MTDHIDDCASLFPDLTVEFGVLKTMEEMGEVADAMIGISGANPRKGTYATADDLSAELLDVALTAMLTWTKLGSRTDPAEALQEHARERAKRHRKIMEGIDRRHGHRFEGTD